MTYDVKLANADPDTLAQARFANLVFTSSKTGGNWFDSQMLLLPSYNSSGRHLRNELIMITEFLNEPGVFYPYFTNERVVVTDEHGTEVGFDVLGTDAWLITNDVKLPPEV